MFNGKNLYINLLKLLIALGYSYGAVHFLQSLGVLNKGFLIGGFCLVILICVPLILLGKLLKE